MDMEETNTKEINLLQLIGLMFEWLKKNVTAIIGFLCYLLRLSYKYIAVTISIMLLSLSIGIYLSRPTARVYSAETIAMIYGTDVQIVMEVFKQLDSYTLQNGKSSLADKLDLPDSVLKNIVGIKCYYVLCYKRDGIAVKIDYKNVYPQKDTMIVKMGDRLSIKILTHNTNQIPLVQTAILKYLNSNTLMRSQFEIHKTELIQQIEICKRENLRIDSLAKVSYFKDSEKQLQVANNSLLLGEQKKQLFYSELLNLQNTKAFAEGSLSNFTNPIVLPAGFTISPKPLNPMAKYSVLGILFGYVMSLLLVLFIDNLKNIKNFFR